MIKTGIFGGSFNPVHMGHIRLAEEICRLHIVDELWLMVSPLNPFKKEQHLMDDTLRLQLARTAVRNHPLLNVSDFEFCLPRPSYMIHTLEKLTEAYPDRIFSLIIGADNWQTFPHWYHYEEILKKYSVIIYPRQGFEIDSHALPANVHYLDLPLYEVSATNIREKLAKGEDVSEWLDPEVEKQLKAFLSKR